MSLPAYLVKYREILGHEPILIPSVTVLIRDQYQRILMARSRDSGLWVAPGGMVDPGENPASAAVRVVSSEIDELRFVAPSELGGLNLAHWARVFLPPILAGEGHRVSLQSSWRPPRAGQ
jgi:8-oxo-dGTP pyrophosphatase MutT (NUDIX family)